MQNIFSLRMKRLLGLPLMLFLMAISMVSLGQTVTVTTDKDDYWPGEWVIITGSGWQNDADVQLTLTHLDPLPDPLHTHETWTVQPNEDGTIYYEWFVEEQELGTSFELTALGLTSGLSAVTYFTDGDIYTLAVSAQSPTVLYPGGTAEYEITITIKKNDGITSPVNVTFDTSFLSNASFNAPSSLTIAGAKGAIFTTTFTINTTSSVATQTFTLNSYLDGSNKVEEKKNQIPLNVTTCITPATPTITAVSSTSLCDGGYVELSSSASTGNQWYQDRTPISGATNQTFTATTAGSYTVITTIDCPSAPSLATDVTVNALPDAPSVVNYVGVYDGSAHSATVTPPSGASVVYYDAATGGNVISAPTATNAGPAIIAYAESVSATGCKSATRRLVSVTITKATATLTLGNLAPHTYDGTEKIATVTTMPSGLTGVSISGNTGNINAGSYPIEATLINDNYEATPVSGNVVIGKAVATIVVNGYTGVYDAAPHGATLVSATGVNSADLSSSVTVGTTTYTNYPGGAVTWSFENNNYVSQNGSVDITINKADAVVTVNGYTGVYDAQAHGATGSFTGVTLDPTAVGASLNLGASFTDVPGGTASWTFNGGTNYNDQSGEVAIVINKAAAIIVVNGYTGVYDAAPHGATLASATGVNSADLSSSVTVGTTTYTNYPGGAVTWSFENNNYVSQNGSVDITINKADAVVTVNGYTGVYEAQAHGATGSFTGVTLDPTAVGASLNLGASFTDVPGGTALWTFDGGTNYNDQSGEVVIVINKAAATIVVNGYTGIYDAAPHGATLVSATGVNSADLSSSVTVGTATYTNYPGGAVTWSFENNNYVSQNGSVDISINKADAVVTVNGYTGVYDAAPHGATGSFTGVTLDPTAVGASLNLGDSFTDVPGGTALWTFDGGTNYNDQSGEVVIVINKANATIVVNGYMGIYDAAPHGATLVSATGVNSADLSSFVTVGTTTYTNYPGGAVTWSFENNNYVSQNGSVDITINKADAVVTVNGYTGVYDAAPHGATGSFTGVTLDPTAVGASLNLGASFTDVPGGTASWTFNGGTNYNDQSGEVAIVINKAAATIVVNGYTGIYDAAPHGATLVSATGVNSADLSSFVTVGTTTYTNYPGGAVTWSFENNNYVSQNGSVDITINKADAVVTVNGYTGVYDAAPHGATGSYTGVTLDPTAVGASLNLGDSFTDVPGGTASWTFNGGTNYNDQSGEVVIVINKANATIVVNGYTGIYDAAPHGATLVSATGVNSADLSSSVTVGTTTYTNYPGGAVTWSFENNNYVSQNGSVDITINKADAVVTVNGYTGVYDAAPHGATGSFTGVAGDLTAVGASLNLGDSFTDVPGGTANWTFAGGTNYLDESGDVVIDIAQAIASVTPYPASKYCGQNDPSPLTTGSKSGFIASDEIKATYSRIEGESTATTYTISAVLSPSDKLSNYNITYNTAQFTIHGVSIDASTSSQATLVNTTTSVSGEVLLKATVTDANNPTVSLSGVSVKFELVLFNAEGNESIVETKQVTTVNGIAQVTVSGLAANLYQVRVTAGSGCDTDVAYLSVADPSAGFVTGGGWIYSSKGSLVDSDAEGKANFGFNAQYKKGKNNVIDLEGNTNFQFSAGNFHFKSSSYDAMTLVISGAKATYRGSGTVNGSGNYGFMISAIDGQINGGQGNDLFRIKIWDKSNGNTVVYDNNTGKDENDIPITALGGGSIVIHSNVNNKKIAQITPEAPAAPFEPVLKAYPNPFTERLSIEFSYEMNTKAKLEIFSVTGARLETLYDGPVSGGQLYKFEYLPRLTGSQMVFYHLTLDGKTKVGKILFNERR